MRNWFKGKSAARRRQPDMVVPSIEGVRWGDLGRLMTPEERAKAVDDLAALLDSRLRSERRGGDDE